LLYNGPLLCGLDLRIKGLNMLDSLADCCGGPPNHFPFLKSCRPIQFAG